MHHHMIVPVMQMGKKAILECLTGVLIDRLAEAGGRGYFANLKPLKDYKLDHALDHISLHIAPSKAKCSELLIYQSEGLDGNAHGR